MQRDKALPLTDLVSSISPSHEGFDTDPADDVDVELLDYFADNFGGLIGAFVRDYMSDARPYTEKWNDVCFWLYENGGRALMEAQEGGNAWAVRNYLHQNHPGVRQRSLADAYRQWKTQNVSP